MPKKSPKMMFLIECKDFFYCVPEKDVLSADIASVMAGHKVSFKYGNLTQSDGTVLLVDGREKVILQEIKKLKKEKRRSKSESFHEDRPRLASLKQRGNNGKSSVQPPAAKTNAASTSGKVKAKLSKAMRSKQNRIEAELRTETVNSSCGEMMSDDNNSLQTSASSIIENKDSKATKRDIARLKSLASGSSGSSPEQHQSSASNAAMKPAVEVSDTVMKPAVEISNTAMKPAVETSNTAMKPAVETSNTAMMPAVETSNTAMMPAVKISDTAMKPAIEGKATDEEDSDPMARQETVPIERSPVKGHKRSRKHRSRKKQKKHRRYSSSSSTSSSSSSSSSSSRSTSTSSSSDCYRRKTKKSKKYKKCHKQCKVQRNSEVYAGVNYLYHQDSPGVVRVHPSYEVYVREDELNNLLNSVKSPTQFIRSLVDKVYTNEALRNATPQGFPPRGKGKKSMRKQAVLPRLHPDGRSAILARATALETERKSWRPRVGEGKMFAAFTGRCSDYRD